MAIRERKTRTQRWRLLIGSVTVAAAALGVAICELPASTPSATASTTPSAEASSTASVDASTPATTAAPSDAATGSTDVSTAAPADPSTDVSTAAPTTEAPTAGAPTDLPTASVDPNPSSTVVVECTSGIVTQGDIQTSSMVVTKIPAGEHPDLPGDCTVHTG